MSIGSFTSMEPPAKFNLPNLLPPPPQYFSTLVEVVQWRAEQSPAHKAFTFLVDGEHEEDCINYAQLDRRARAIAATLLTRAQPADRALLMFDPGIDYIAALLGCFYAGVVAVPMYPPDPLRLQRTFPRLKAVVVNAEARLALGSSSILEWVGGPLASQCSLEALAIEDVELQQADNFDSPAPQAEQTAFFQYTSGSTDVPKGVVLSHANLMHNLAAIDVMIAPGITGCTWLPPYHDMGLIGTILGPLYSGRHNVLMSPISFMQKPIRWLQAITRFRASTSGCPNFGYAACLKKIKDSELAGLDLSSWEMSFNGAEPVRAETMQRFVEKFAPCGLPPTVFAPCYGMAESTLIITGAERGAGATVQAFDKTELAGNRAVKVEEEADSAQTIVGCGRPIEGLEVIIVDPDTQVRLPENQVGEIWVRGGSIASGYFNRPQETAAAFNVSPAGEPNETGFLRTGDLGFLAEGELFVTGRLKELMILWGRNYYPHDIEQTVERAHEALKVEGGACFSIEEGEEEKLVVVHEVLRPRRYDLEEVIQAVRRQLAEERELAPHAVVLITTGSLPKTTSGKTQRGECKQRFLKDDLSVLAQWRADGSAGDGEAQEIEPPLPGIETEVAEIWSEVLGISPIGRQDDFFLHGGQSLKAVQLMGRLAEEFGGDPPLRMLFEHPLLSDFCAALELWRNEDGHAASHSAVIARRPDNESPLPLSYSQERLWFIEQAEAGEAVSHVPVAVAVRGKLDCKKLGDALNEVIARHEILRTTFAASRGRSRQIVHDFLPVSLVEETVAQADAQDRIAVIGNEPFDLKTGPLLRLHVLHTGNGEHTLLFVLHHIICDGWSAEILLREVAAAYEGNPKKSLGLQYADYAAWQRSPQREKELAAGLEYWKSQLAGATNTLDLPVDAPRRANQQMNPAEVSLAIPASLWKKVESAARSQGATPFMAWLAVYEALLARYSGKQEFCVAVPTANRPHVQLEQVLGCFVNLLALRAKVEPSQKCGELLARVRETSLAAFEHQQTPFEKVVEAVQPARHPGRLPLVDVLFLLQSPGETPHAMGEVVIDSIDVDYSGLALFDLSLILEPRGGKRFARMVFNRELFEESTILRMLQSLLTAAEEIIVPHQSIAELPIPAPAEKRELLEDFNRTGHDYPPDQTVYQLIAAAAKKHPAKTAIRFGKLEVSYQSLIERASRIAGLLKQNHVGRGCRVGLMLSRSPDVVAAMLAVHQVGAAYIPLDPSFPQQRLQFMAEDAELQLIITEKKLAELVPAEIAAQVCLDECEAKLASLPSTYSSAAVTPQEPAYILYTSGSTGKPKGVVVPHRGTMNLIEGFGRVIGYTANDRVLAITTISFDISFTELLLPLTRGSEVVLADEETAGDGIALAKLAGEARVTIMQATPATWRMLLTGGWRSSPGITMICGGEALDAPLAEQLLVGGGTLFNAYGPTEATVWSTVHPVLSGEFPVLIGRPIDNTTIYILDDAFRPVPIGVSGELCIGGDGLAVGYWKRAELTEEKFIPSPFCPENAKLYRTGDRARWRSDGTIEFQGRFDHQMKIRGFRIEPGEIETVLASHPAVDKCAILAHADSAGEYRLSAYVTPVAGEEIVPNSLKQHLGERLPSYMIPTLFIALEKMPLTGSGKIDRNALPAPEGAKLAKSQQYEAPEGPIEKKIASVWSEILGVETIGRFDNFFELGGHSLLAMQLLAYLKEIVPVDIPVRDLFEAPTVAGIGEIVTEKLLDQLDQLSDEDAQLLLQQEDTPSTPQ